MTDIFDNFDNFVYQCNITSLLMGNDKQQVIKEICAINAVINYHKKNNLSEL